MTSQALLTLSALGLLASCGASRAPRGSPPPRPRIVVAVVVDQLATHALERHLPHLPEEGALRRGIARGALHRHVVYPYAGTYTAAGHAAIATGAPPAVSGVVANEVYDRERARVVAIVDDGEHAVHGVPDAYASPRALHVETVADALERATDGRARVVSLSIKDRAVAFTAGRTPDLALWYDARLPGYTSSTFYGELPAWLEAWQREHPIDALLTPWVPGDPALLARVAGEDDAEGEGDWHGLGATFPHDPRASTEPYSVLRATPQSSEHLLELAGEAARRAELGEDEVPDLLVLSISSTDYVAHTFGPDSWEYLDNLIRVDRALGAFLDRLERERGPIAVLLTSDHGGAPLPERSGTGRLMPEAIASELEAELDRALGEGEWVSAFVQPFVYLSEEAREDRRERAVRAAIAWLSARPEIGFAADAREALGWRDHEDPLRRAVGLSVAQDFEGDVFVVPREGFVVDEDMPRGFGTSHGTPWSYDRTVPVILWGAGVAHLETDAPLPQGRVASTLAALLGIAPPAAAPRAPLPGVSVAASR